MLNSIFTLDMSSALLNKECQEIIINLTSCSDSLRNGA